MATLESRLAALEVKQKNIVQVSSVKKPDLLALSNEEIKTFLSGLRESELETFFRGLTGAELDVVEQCIRAANDANP